MWVLIFFFFSSRRRHTRWPRDWSSDVCSSDLILARPGGRETGERERHREKSPAWKAGPYLRKRGSLHIAPHLRSNYCFLSVILSLDILSPDILSPDILSDFDFFDFL